jgi:hypothetical protein
MMVGEKGAEAIIPLDKAGYGNKIEIIVDVHNNVFSKEIDVSRVFEQETEKMVRKLVSQGIGRLPS